MRDVAVQERIILAIRKVGDGDTQEGTCEHVLPVMAVVHCARDCHECCARERDKRQPRLTLQQQLSGFETISSADAHGMPILVE